MAQIRTSGIRISGPILLGLALLAGTAAAAPLLDLPIRCTLGVDCHIQNFFDHDPGPGWHDYSCGSLSYDTHHGTDFRVADLAAMEAGVDVVAAAAGVVKAVREGEPDVSVRQRGRDNLDGKDAGNGVLIDHGDGWQTQYSHLRRGSVAVGIGQRVEAGTILGKVGLSGNTEFPHVDFVVRRNGLALDPFAPQGGTCGVDQEGLWRPELKNVLRYRPSGLLRAGFGDAPPKSGATGEALVASAPTAGSPAIMFWIEVFGLRKDDIVEMTLVDPDGRSLARNRTRVDRNKAAWRSVVGKRRISDAWAPGVYRGRLVLRRDEAAVIDETRTIHLQ